MDNEVNYKQSTVAKARDLLSEAELHRLVDEEQFDEFIERMEKIGTDTNLLWLQVPRAGDLSILYRPELDRPSFCEAVIDLLYGPDPSEARLARYAAHVAVHGLPNKWTFPTYFLFICHPDTEMFVKPKTTRWFLDFIGGPKLSFGTPVPEQYAAVKQAVHELKEELQEYGPRDMVDIQGLIWTAYRAEPKEDPEAPPVSDTRLGTPFSQIFTDRAEAEWAFDLTREVIERLGITNPRNERFALTLGYGGSVLRLNYGKWAVLHFYGPGSQYRVGLALIDEAVDIAGSFRQWDSFAEGEPTISVYELPVEMVRPLEGNLRDVYERSLDSIAERFGHWRACPFRRFNRLEIAEAVFDPEKRNKLLSEGLSQATLKLTRIDQLINLNEVLPPERIEARQEGEARARALLERKLGQFDEADLHQFFKDLNADWWNGKRRTDRFMPALYGHQVNLMIETLPAFNDWTQRIWQAADDDLDALLDEFWERLEVSGAGVSLPTALLYLRDPEHCGIWLPVMSQGLEIATNFQPGDWRTAQGYRSYNAAVNELRERYGLPPQALDVALWQISKEQDEGEIQNTEYSLAQCAQDTGFDREMLARWIRAIERKKQAVLYGPPGTGKTYLAERLARHLIGGGDGFYEVVQFHPAYAYEDFIQGIRPRRQEGGGLDYPIVPGRFLQFCSEARKRNGLCVLIIDEINRANLARVFGELMYLLEYRDREIPLAGGGPFSPFSIPENVRIIGTMNTADRSIALVDHALRRRFAFLALYPDYEVLRRYHQETGFPVGGLIQVLKQLNAQIGDRHYHVGITFFLRPDLGTHIADIWEMEIEPYLDEYFFDRPDRAKAFQWEQIESKVMQ